MSIEIIDILKPKNGLSFKLIEDVDIAVSGYSSLADCVAHMATTAMIEAINVALSGKANTSNVNTAVDDLQNQIDQIVISASAESVVAPEVAQARVDQSGTSFSTLKERLDSDSVKADRTSDAVDEIYTAISEIESVGELASGYYSVSAGVGGEIATEYTQSSEYGSIMINCSAGDRFKLSSVSGANAGRLYAFIDGEGTILEVADAYEAHSASNPIVITAPKYSAKVQFVSNIALSYRNLIEGLTIINFAALEDRVVSCELTSTEVENAREDYNSLKDRLDADSAKVTSVSHDVEQISETLTEWEYVGNLTSGYYSSATGVGEPIATEKTQSTDYGSIIVPCGSGDKFKLAGVSGANAGRLYTFIDENDIIISVADAYEGHTALNPIVITAPQNAARVQFVSRISGQYANNISKKSTIDVKFEFSRIENSNGKLEYRFSPQNVPQLYESTTVEALDGTGIFDADTVSPAQIYELYDALVLQYPDYISKVDYGLDQSGEYHIYGYNFFPETIEDEHSVITTDPYPVPKISIRGGIHGDGTDAGDPPEMICALYFFLSEICNNWKSSDVLNYLRWNIRFSVLPIMNPWGVENKSRRNSRQVDINRNFPFGWVESTPGTNSYGGPEPMSEAESSAIMDFLDDNTDAICDIEFHTTSGTQLQSHLMYCSTYKTSEMYYVLREMIHQLSRKWNADRANNGLSDLDMYGYFTVRDSGYGIPQCYVTNSGVPSCTVEGFQKISDSAIPKDGLEIMRMCTDEVGNSILNAIKYFKEYKNSLK